MTRFAIILLSLFVAVSFVGCPKEPKHIVEDPTEPLRLKISSLEKDLKSNKTDLDRYKTEFDKYKIKSTIELSQLQVNDLTDLKVTLDNQQEQMVNLRLQMNQEVESSADADRDHRLSKLEQGQRNLNNLVEVLEKNMNGCCARLAAMETAFIMSDQAVITNTRRESLKARRERERQEKQIYLSPR